MTKFISRMFPDLQIFFVCDKGCKLFLDARWGEGCPGAGKKPLTSSQPLAGLPAPPPGVGVGSALRKTLEHTTPLSGTNIFDTESAKRSF